MTLQLSTPCLAYRTVGESRTKCLASSNMNAKRLVNSGGNQRFNPEQQDGTIRAKPT